MIFSFEQGRRIDRISKKEERRRVERRGRERDHGKVSANGENGRGESDY